MNIGSAIAAAGTSIMPPTGTYSSNFTPSSFSCSLACATAACAWFSSFHVESIGIRISTLPWREARRIARSCVLNTSGSARQ